MTLFFCCRHSRFGGTYVLRDVKSISDNDMILFKPISKVDSLSLSDKKVSIYRILITTVRYLSFLRYLYLLLSFEFSEQNKKAKE